jgi:hypothetical protein
VSLCFSSIHTSLASAASARSLSWSRTKKGFYNLGVWKQRLQSVARLRLLRAESALILAFVLFLAAPASEDIPGVTRRARRAEQLVAALRTAIPIQSEVQLAVVLSHPLVFSVELEDKSSSRFLLSMELGFLQMLEEDELQAALAHELGHVWIFTHHPFLQTERLANQIGQRAVNRRSFEKLYMKLWTYEGKPGVPMDELLGTPPQDAYRDEH